MVNKKSLIALIIFALCSVAVFAQSTGSFKVDSTADTENITESDIIFSDNTLNSSDSETEAYKGPSTIGLLIRVIIVLIIVVGVIYGVLWFIKRKTNIVKTEDDFLRRAAYINIAPGKSVEVITLIDKAYLIGVTEDNITLLGEIDDKELINAMNVNADKNQNIKKPLNFAEVLDIFTKGKKTTSIFTETESKVENLYQNSEDKQ